MRLPRRSVVTLSAVSVFYGVGLIGHLLPTVKPVMLLATPWFLWGAGAAVLVSFFWGRAPWFVASRSVPLFLFAFGVEVLGVGTGWVFGPYRYGDGLGFLVAGVPPVIGWNWLVVVIGVHTVVRWVFPQIAALLRVGLVGLVCVAFDWLMEPAAVHLGYWTWLGGSVPLQNYLAWGVIAMAGAWWAERRRLWPEDPIVAWSVLCQAFFFAVLGLAEVKA